MHLKLLKDELSVRVEKFRWKPMHGQAAKAIPQHNVRDVFLLDLYLGDDIERERLLRVKELFFILT